MNCRLLSAAFLLSAVFSHAQLFAQEAAAVKDNEPDPVEVENIEIDVNAMLIYPDTVTMSIARDPLFRVFSSGQGPGGFGGETILIQVPLDIKPSKDGKIFKLDSRSLAMKGGKLICYRLEVDDELRRKDRGAGIGAGQEQLSRDAPPRFSKELYIMPNGRVRWKITRILAIKNAVIQGSGQYRDRLDPKFLAAKKPRKPAGRTPQERMRAMKAVKDYIEYSSRIRKLPTLLEEDMPKHIWAVFEFQLKKKDISITSKNFEWPIFWDDFQAMNNLRKPIADREYPKGVDGQPNKSKLPAKRKEMLEKLLQVMKDRPHPYNVKLIATSLSESKLFHFCKETSDIATLAKIIVRKGDLADRARIGKAVATTFPPSLCVLDLLKELKPLLDPSSVATIESEQLKKPSDWNNPQQVTRYIDEHITRLKAPDSKMSVSQIMDAMVEITTKHVKTKEMLKRLAFNLPLAKLPPARRTQMIAYLLANGGANNLCAFMVNERIFGATENAVPLEALNILKTATIATDNKKRGVANAKALVMVRPLYINTSKYRYLSFLKHSDEKISKLAWSVLKHFQCMPGVEAQKQGDRFDMLVLAALDTRPMPIEIISFLSKQRHSSHQARVIESLATLIQRGESNIKILASRALVGQPGPIDKLLVSMPFEERYAFIRRLYQANEKTMPLVAGLLRMRSPSNPVLLWFAKKIASGEFPPAEEWAEVYEKDENKRDKALISLVGLGDETLDRAVLAALATDAGGSDKIVENIYEDWKEAEVEMESTVKVKDKKTKKVVAKKVKKKVKVFGNLEAMTLKWGEAKQKIYLERLKAFQGAYSLRVRSIRKNQIIMKSELKVADNKVMFGDTPLSIVVPKDDFGLVLDKPAQLNEIDHPLMKEIPFENAFKTVTLKPFEKDFVGQVPLGQAGTVEIWIEAINR